MRGELTWDEVAAIDPDVIITEKVSGSQDLLASEAFSQLSAVKNGKVYSAYHSVTGLFRVTDDSGETFLYSPEDFEIVEEY